MNWTVFNTKFQMTNTQNKYIFQMDNTVRNTPN